jgi:hypothetical protein
MSNYHLAQLNIAKAKDEMNSATMKGFVDRLDEINSLADRSPGFIWRLQTEEGDATSIKIFNDPYCKYERLGEHRVFKKLRL